jgi:hypothetical protein
MAVHKNGACSLRLLDPTETWLGNLRALDCLKSHVRAKNIFLTANENGSDLVSKNRSPFSRTE